MNVYNDSSSPASLLLRKLAMEASADNLWDLFHDGSKFQKLSSGLNAVDGLLDGGFSTGEICEVRSLSSKSRNSKFDYNYTNNYSNTIHFI